MRIWFPFSRTRIPSKEASLPECSVNVPHHCYLCLHEVNRSGYHRSSTQGRKSRLMRSRDSQGPMAESRAGQGPQPLHWPSALCCSRMFQSVLCFSTLFRTIPHSSTLSHLCLGAQSRDSCQTVCLSFQAYSKHLRDL